MPFVVVKGQPEDVGSEFQPLKLVPNTTDLTLQLARAHLKRLNNGVLDRVLELIAVQLCWDIYSTRLLTMESLTSFASASRHHLRRLPSSNLSVVQVARRRYTRMLLAPLDTYRQWGSGVSFGRISSCLLEASLRYDDCLYSSLKTFLY